MNEQNYELVASDGVPIKAWIKGVPVEPDAMAQVKRTAALPFVRHVALMPDCHYGIGATVGSVIATKGAIVPASVGVDLGCGMCAVKTNLTASRLPDNLSTLRSAIEAAIPVGPASHKDLPRAAERRWYKGLKNEFQEIEAKHPSFSPRNSPALQIGTLGGGNHFIEVCLDTDDNVWIMLHSGSRGIGNKIGTYFIAKAKEEMVRLGVPLADKDLAFLTENTVLFNDYIQAVDWAQDYAASNRDAMLELVMAVIYAHFPGVSIGPLAVNCHHNYIERGVYFGESLLVTRKGAVRAGKGDLGIIPGSMGAKSFIVRGKGNEDSLHSCSHGAGRVMSRGEAKRRFSVADHVAATAGIECRKDAGVIDETPMAYKNIDSVMGAQSDLVDIVATLRQVLCVKG